MLTRELINNSALMRFRLGVVLIWLGVLTWMPFIVLRITGEKPSLFMFLPFHLIGVIGGSRVRSLARRELGLAAPKKDVWRSIGHAMIFLGILVWLPYFYLKLVVHQYVDVINFLPFHLTGIFGGIAFLGISYWFNRRER